MFQTNGFGYLLALRIATLFDRRADWSLRLWRHGSVTQLHELLALAASQSSAGARTYALAAARRAVLRDPAIPARRRGLILSALPKTGDIDRFMLRSNSYLLLEQEVQSLEKEYLNFWIDLIRSEGEDVSLTDASPGIDLCSWLIGSYMRGCGLSANWILNHCNYELKRKPSASSLINILEVAQSAIRQGPGKYTFMLPLTRSAHINSRTDMPWLSRAAFRARFAEVFPGAPLPDCQGGLQLDVLALDKYGAQKSAVRHLGQAETRVAVSSYKRVLVHTADAWMSPGDTQVKLAAGPNEDLRIPALDEDGGRLLFKQLPSDVEAAFDLLASSSSGHGSERLACVGAWAALEGLLADREDFGNLADIADRAADILACCYIERIFTDVAIAHSRTAQDQLSSDLKDKDTAEQIRLVEEHMLLGRSICVGEGNGAVTGQKIALVVSGRSELTAVRNEISEAFRRLYQARNYVIHRGEGLPYGIDMIVPSSHILLSEVIDKAITASRRSGEPAGLLAAKARWALQRVEDGDSLSLLGRL